MEKLKENDIITVEILDNGMEGEGIARYGEYTVFVPFCLKGETVKAKIVHVRRNLAYSELKDVLKSAPQRTKPACNRFMRCGGCDLLHAEYGLQLEIKRNNLVNLLKKNAGYDCAVEEIESCSTPFGYRNKIQLPFGMTEGRVSLGFYQENSHKVVSITKCFLHGDWAEKLIGVFLEYANRRKLTVYDESKRQGFLKHLVARYIDGNIAIVLVTADGPLPQTEELLLSLGKVFPKFSLYRSVKNEHNNVVMGARLIAIQKEPLFVEVMGIKAELNPHSFLQLNSEIRDKIYGRIVSEIITKKGEPIVVDAYAGIGILGAVIAKHGASVYNIEIVPEATEDGKNLAQTNGIADRCVQINGDAAVELPKLIRTLKGTQKLEDSNLNIILDPPRKGCNPLVLDALNELSIPHSLYYISCNPATLTRDMKVLSDYTIDYIKPYDMFSHTHHCEVLVRLTWKKRKQK